MRGLETLVEIGCILESTSDIRLASQASDSLEIFKALVLLQLSPWVKVGTSPSRKEFGLVTYHSFR